LYAGSAMCEDHPVRRSRAESRPARTRSQRKRRAWALILPLLLAPMLVLSRYDLGWAAAELAALIAWWPPVVLIKPATWRRGPWWAFPFFAFVMTTLFFAVVALLVGVWLPPWWSLAIALGAGILAVASIWPTQLRHYRLQRRLLDAEREHAS
jgi:hypothetical protein